MIKATFLASCYFQIAGDKPYLQCKHEVSFDKPAIILHRKKRRTAFLSGLYTSSQPHVSWGKVCHIIPCPAKSYSWGSPPLSDMSIHHSFKLSGQEVAFPSPSYCGMQKGNRGLISGPGQESRSRLLQKVWVCFFQKGSEEQVIRCDYKHQG